MAARRRSSCRSTSYKAPLRLRWAYKGHSSDNSNHERDGEALRHGRIVSAFELCWLLPANR